LLYDKIKINNFIVFLGIINYSSVLIFKECPLAIEAAEGLLSLGVKGTEVNAMMLEMVGINGLEWLVFNN